MGGGNTASTTTKRLNGIQIQQSIAGAAKPIGWGTFRVSPNLLWYGDFQSKAQSSGGKGGGSPTSYDYSASLVMGICAGPIGDVRTVYKDNTALTQGDGKSGTALQQAGLSVASGAYGQAPWSYLTSSFPGQAIGYSGIAYAYVANYDLGSSASLPNLTFEVVSTTRHAGLDDASPADIVADFLSQVPYWQAGFTGDLTNYGDYCVAAGLLLSPVLDTQRQASDFLTEILTATNSDAVFSDAVLKIVPYGDTEITGNGVTWTPNLTPVYDLDDSIFIPPSQGADPVEVDINRAADAYNYVQVEYYDRANQYNSQIAVAMDQAAIDQNGRRPNTSPHSLHSICQTSIASTIAQLIVQRTANVRRTFRFTLPISYCLLEPQVDIVTLTSGDLVRVPVRITQLQERADGNAFADVLDVEAEEVLIGTAHAAEYTRQGNTGYTPDRYVDPGSVAEFALICPPRTLTSGDYQVWIGAAGASANWGGCQIWTSLDGENYAQVGSIDAAARIGPASALPAATDPDTAHTLTVDLSAVGGELLPASQAEVDKATTLFLIDEELLAYRDASLVGPNQYQLGYLRRGLYGTTPAAHTANAAFVRLDSALAEIPYDAAQVGATLYVKLLSFNIFGAAVQSLADVTAATIQLEPGAAPTIDIIVTDTLNVGGRPSSTVLSQIDQLLQTIATLNDSIAQANDALSQAQSLLAQAQADVESQLGVQETTGQALIKQALAHLDLRNLANSWTSLDGDRITTPVAYGKQALGLLGTVNSTGTAFVFHGDTTWISATQSFADYQTQVQANYQSNLTLISTEESTRATADEALSARIDTLTATVNGNTASIQTIETTQATDEQTFSSQISTLNSNYNGLSATVSSNYSTLTNSTDAIAAAVLGTSATLNGQTTQVSLNETSLATATGQLYGSVTLKTNAGGHVASMQLLSASGATNLGAVVFDVSTFLVGSSENPGVAPFYFDATTGTLFSANLVVQTANIADLSVDTIKVKGGALSNSVSYEVDNSGTLTPGSSVTALTYSYTPDNASSRLQLAVYVEIGSPSGQTQDGGAAITVQMDGATIGTAGLTIKAGFGGTGTTVPINVVPGSGSHTFTVSYQATGGGAGNITVNKTVLTITELKK